MISDEYVSDFFEVHDQYSDEYVRQAAKLFAEAELHPDLDERKHSLLIFLVLSLGYARYNEGSEELSAWRAYTSGIYLHETGKTLELGKQPLEVWETYRYECSRSFRPEKITNSWEDDKFYSAILHRDRAIVYDPTPAK